MIMTIVCGVWSTHCEDRTGWHHVLCSRCYNSPSFSCSILVPFSSFCFYIYITFRTQTVPHFSNMGSRCSRTDCYQPSPCLLLSHFITTYSGAWRPPTRPHVSLICLHSPVSTVPNFAKSRQTCTQWMSPCWLYAKNACVNPHAGDRDILTTGLMTSCCQLVVLNTAHRQMTRYSMWRSRWQWNRWSVRVSTATVVAIAAVVTMSTMLVLVTKVTRKLMVNLVTMVKGKVIPLQARSDP